AARLNRITPEIKSTITIWKPLVGVNPTKVPTVVPSAIWCGGSSRATIARRNARGLLRQLKDLIEREKSVKKVINPCKLIHSTPKGIRAQTAHFVKLVACA